MEMNRSVALAPLLAIAVLFGCGKQGDIPVTPPTPVPGEDAGAPAPFDAGHARSAPVIESPRGEQDAGAHQPDVAGVPASAELASHAASQAGDAAAEAAEAAARAAEAASAAVGDVARDAADEAAAVAERAQAVLRQSQREASEEAGALVERASEAVRKARAEVGSGDATTGARAGGAKPDQTAGD